MNETLEKPYLEKFREVGDFTVWIIDGKYVRERLNQDFTNFGEHYRFPFIPTYEFWLDGRGAIPEADYFIEHLIAEWKSARRGSKKDLPLTLGDRAEKALRNRSKEVLALKRCSPKVQIERIHKRLIRSLSNGVEVWLARGELVRSLYFLDFTMGGHDKVYRFVPPGEVWIDDTLDEREHDFVIVHEVRERRLMSGGWPYFKAHRSANAIEFPCRAHPERLERALALELALNMPKRSAKQKPIAHIAVPSNAVLERVR